MILAPGCRRFVGAVVETCFYPLSTANEESGAETHGLAEEGYRILYNMTAVVL